MIEDTDWISCYEVLGVAPESNWDELRTAYRRLAQSWHPDRFAQDTQERDDAEKRIVSINQAYQALSDYYQEQGHLPGELLQRPRYTRTATPVDDNPPEKTYKKKKRPGLRTRFFSRILIPVRSVIKPLLFLSVVAVVYNFLSSADPDSYEQASRPPPQTQILDKFFSPAPRKYKKTDDYFTIGSTIGEVHAIQGNPTRVVDSVWYYGDSEVLFTNGVVESWKNAEGYPLNVKLVSKPSGQDISYDRLPSRFSIGSTKKEVRAIQGKPIIELGDIWNYGVAEVYFKNGKVSGWRDSPLSILKAKKSDH